MELEGILLGGLIFALSSLLLTFGVSSSLKSASPGKSSTWATLAIALKWVVHVVGVWAGLVILKAEPVSFTLGAGIVLVAQLAVFALGRKNRVPRAFRTLK